MGNWSVASNNTLKLYLLALINFVAFSCISFSVACSQMSMRRKVTSLSFLYLVAVSCNVGNAAMHGVHQVAQKSSNTTFPFKEDKDTDWAN